MSRWWRRWRISGNGECAEAAKREAERRLRETRQQWPQVREARAELAAWVDQALRGGA
jgi:hypothetical protein